MRCRVLCAFPYAHDGRRTRMLAKGEEPDVRDELIEGLSRAGLIYVPPAPPIEAGSPPAAPETPGAAPAPSNADRRAPPENRAQPRGKRAS